MKPTWTANRIEHEAVLRCEMPQESRRWARRGDYDYADRLYENQFIAMGAGLMHVSRQKAECAEKYAANINAVWERVEAILAANEINADGSIAGGGL